MENYVIIFDTNYEAKRGFHDFCKVNPEVIKTIVDGAYSRIVCTHNGNKFRFCVNNPQILQGVKPQNIFTYDFDQHRLLPAAGINV